MRTEGGWLVGRTTERVILSRADGTERTEFTPDEALAIGLRLMDEATQIQNADHG